MTPPSITEPLTKSTVAISGAAYSASHLPLNQIVAVLTGIFIIIQGTTHIIKFIHYWIDRRKAQNGK